MCTCENPKDMDDLCETCTKDFKAFVDAPYEDVLSGKISISQIKFFGIVSDDNDEGNS